MIRRFFLLIVSLFIFLAISASFYFRNSRAQDTALSTDTEITVIKKLDKIIDSQKTILQQLNAMKKEIRTRCSD